MNANHLESRLPPIDSNLNRLGVDEDNLRHLKAVFVKDMLERRSGSKHDIETVCLLSPDVALLMLRDQHEWEAHVLEYIGNAEKAMEELAFKVDADGRHAEQIKSDLYFLDAEEERSAAIATLRRFAARGNGPLSRKAEEEKNAALQVLVPLRDPKETRTLPGGQARDYG